MVVALHHPQDVFLHVLARHEPGRVVSPTALRALVANATDTQSLALANGVEAQPHVLTQRTAGRVLDRSGLLCDVPVQKVAERPLPDEADAGGVFLARIRQPDLVRDAADFDLAQFTDREKRPR